MSTDKETELIEVKVRLKGNTECEKDLSVVVRAQSETNFNDSTGSELIG